MAYHLYKHLTTKREVTIVDRMMSAAAIIHPLMALPQVWLIYSTKQVAGLSLFMWAAWLVLGLIFLTYGMAHRLKPYILMQILWVGIDIAVITGILIYR